MNYEIVIATNNQDKIDEIKAYFVDYTVDFLTLRDIKLKLAVNETGKTFLENALIKAKAVAKSVNKTIISDDSGLQVAALNGFPGVYSARWNDHLTQDEKNLELIQMVDAHKLRKAQYTCALVIHYPHKEIRFFVGTTAGKIAKKPIEGPYGFGYDPIFISDQTGKPFSQLTMTEKNEISHRGRALEKLKTCLLEKKLITKIKKGQRNGNDILV
jgi:XTP/dITP diphosphohydrolase